MKIGIVGGTGDIGKGLALRIAQTGEHEVFVGSRDAEKGEKAAEEYADALDNENIRGGSNTDAAKTDVVILGVPYEYAVDTVESIKDELPDEAT
ncbi:MAG: NAD(P)-binding domain-containing protein, partial [Halobacteria archaeon]|nr:NAD(P)-binding domain-containing protein [Halobacteria archaeon]